MEGIKMEGKEFNDWEQFGNRVKMLEIVLE